MRYCMQIKLHTLMTSLMKRSDCLYCISFNIKHKGEPRTLIPRKSQLSVGTLLLIQAQCTKNEICTCNDTNLSILCKGNKPYTYSI